MIAVPDELQDALKKSGVEPLRLRDPSTQEEFVVVRAEDWERLRGVFDGDRTLTRDEQFGLLHQAGLRAGWDDPEMDVYNDLVD
ncbi:MAG: hypothetical protein DWQ34_15660 [Planctomycetota bacterium]|nr:MAG: hypothetical protein DWQ29_07830 [Planctomycetota bacterium]REJ91174.1 MAG: hypothetical protein DWQ34_15660 [Planctomycetota bacterium]REK20348.1 MAG: hypothetical protein DWQ41_25500 [Planctomycetota bacterium]REK26845.1 MAG: hypothetical protein DWQ45_26800 [Planctomycetota bacterium]